MLGLSLILAGSQPMAEPMQAVVVDDAAFTMARDLVECMKSVQATEREQLRSLDTEARQKRVAEACEVARRNGEILERLRVVHPDLAEEQLLEEHKKLVLLATFYRPPPSPAQATEGAANE